LLIALSLCEFLLNPFRPTVAIRLQQ